MFPRAVFLVNILLDCELQKLSEIKKRVIVKRVIVRTVFIYLNYVPTKIIDCKNDAYNFLIFLLNGHFSVPIPPSTPKI